MPLEIRETPNDSDHLKDFVSLKKNCAYAREYVLNHPAGEPVHLKLRCYYIIYEEGKEGDSAKVSNVIRSDILEYKTETAPTTQTGTPHPRKE